MSEIGRMKGESEEMASSLNPHPSSLSPWPHRIAVVTVCATVLLLFIGGLVTSKGAGLAVPDWPTTFGYNMFLYPWAKMVGNIFYEHSHRLVASAVGLLTIALALTIWFQERRHWLRALGIVALILVITQGIIGGLRVVLLENTLAIVHAALAQAFFAVAVSLAVFTSAEWRAEPAGKPQADGSRLRRLCAITTGLLYVQAILGAVLRHTGERLELHLIFAGLVALHVIFIFVRVMRFHADQPHLTRPAGWLGLLLFVQVALGMASYFGKFTAPSQLSQSMVVFLTTSHLVIGALMLATSLLLALRSFRLFPSPKVSVKQEILRQEFSL